MRNSIVPKIQIMLQKNVRITVTKSNMLDRHEITEETEEDGIGQREYDCSYEDCTEVWPVHIPLLLEKP